MKKIAIKGMPNKGKMIIDILEKAGGTNMFKLNGNDEGKYYFIETYAPVSAMPYITSDDEIPDGYELYAPSVIDRLDFDSTALEFAKAIIASGRVSPEYLSQTGNSISEIAIRQAESFLKAIENRQ